MLERQMMHGVVAVLIILIDPQSSQRAMTSTLLYHLFRDMATTVQMLAPVAVVCFVTFNSSIQAHFFNFDCKILFPTGT